MRYRPVSMPSDVRKDVEVVRSLIGPKDYFYCLEDVGRRLRKKGYVTESDDVLHSLELQLFSIEVNHKISRGRSFGDYKAHHEGFDFLIGLGQTIPKLSSSAQARLKKSFIGFLKNSNLRSLQHELRAAGRLCKSGCDVSFPDFEGKERFDLLGEKNGINYELDAKNVSPYSGHPIPPETADKLFHEFRHGFSSPISSQIPVIDIVFQGSLSTKRELLQNVVEKCSQVARSGADLTMEDGTHIRLVGFTPNLPPEEIIQGIRRTHTVQPTHIYIRRANPQLVLRVRSMQPSKLLRNITATISFACKEQFTKKNPAILSVHVDHIGADLFRSLSQSTRYITPMDNIASAAFGSEKRRHLTQLVFTGAAEFSSEGLISRSSTRYNIYNSDCSEFNVPFALPNGRSRTAQSSP